MLSILPECEMHRPSHGICSVLLARACLIHPFLLLYPLPCALGVFRRSGGGLLEECVEEVDGHYDGGAEEFGAPDWVGGVWCAASHVGGRSE